jgi:hypothetical protein
MMDWLWAGTTGVVVLLLWLLWKASASIRDTEIVMRELAQTALYELPNGMGMVDLDAITLIAHDYDGLNTRVWLDRAEDDELPPGMVRGVPWPQLTLSWAHGVELQQAWKARVEEKRRRLQKR